MLLYNMNSEEVYREVTKDIEPLTAFLLKKWNKIRRVLREQHRLPAVSHNTYKFSETQNIWNFIFSARTKKELEKPVIQMWTTYESPYGRGAYVVNGSSSDGRTIEVFNFTTHFLKRFQSRHFESLVKEHSYETIDNLMALLIENPTIRYIRKDDTNIEGHLLTGTFFGEDMGKGLFLVKTFVSTDMLYCTQLARSEEDRMEAFSDFTGNDNLFSETSKKSKKAESASSASSASDPNMDLLKKLREDLPGPRHLGLYDV